MRQAVLCPHRSQRGVCLLYSLALVTNRHRPDEDELRMLREGDERLLSVLRTGRTLQGKRIVDRWGGLEPPVDVVAQVEGPLTERQQEIARLVIEGLSPEEIAGRMKLSAWTVLSHMKGLREKTGQRLTWRAAVVAGVAGWL